MKNKSRSVEREKQIKQRDHIIIEYLEGYPHKANYEEQEIGDQAGNDDLGNKSPEVRVKKTHYK